MTLGNLGPQSWAGPGKSDKLIEKGRVENGKKKWCFLSGVGGFSSAFRLKKNSTQLELGFFDLFLGSNASFEPSDNERCVNLLLLKKFHCYQSGSNLALRRVVFCAKKIPKIDNITPLRLFFCVKLDCPQGCLPRDHRAALGQTLGESMANSGWAKSQSP